MKERASAVVDPRAVDDGEEIRTSSDAARVFFSRPGPRLIAKKAGIAWGIRLAMGPFGGADAAACGAVALVWPFQEWVAHKYLLHLEPNGRFDPLFARKHREHHRDPRDLDLTFLPVEVIKSAMPVNVAMWPLVLGPTCPAVTGIAAYSTMALLYEWTHFLVHTGYKPKSAFFKKVRKNHRLHHYRSEHNWYGFTMPIVDQLLGTDPDPRSIPHSPTVRDLFGAFAEEEAEARADARVGASF